MFATVSMVLLDLAAIAALTFGIYFPRHRRADLAVAFLGVNIGVLAVSQVLASSTVGAGLGLGLFGVLSIIRLRSSEISQREVAYYFASLALGLIAGLSTSITAINISMMVLILVVLAVADTTLLARNGSEHQTIQLDRAIADDTELRQELENLTGASVHSVSVIKLDLVNDLTLVEVRLLRDDNRTQSPAAAQSGQQAELTQPAHTAPAYPAPSVPQENPHRESLSQPAPIAATGNLQTTSFPAAGATNQASH